MIGAKLKELRKTKNLTLSDVAKKSELSVAYISNVERDVTSPTLNNLFKICMVLNADITSILSDTSINKTIVRKSERRQVFFVNSKIKYELTTEGTQSLKGVCITIPEDYGDEVISTAHERDELGIVLRGELYIKLNDQEYILHEEDSVYITKGTDHRYRNNGKGECVTYWSFIKEDNPRQ